MTDAEFDELCRYVRWAANAIGLRDWEFYIERQGIREDDPELSDESNRTLAFVEAPPGRRFAKVKFCEDFRELDPRHQRHTVVHELVHCHFTPMQHQVEYDLERHLSQQMDDLFSTTFRRNLEYGVDAVASVIAENLPLIEWPDEETTHG